MSFSDILNQNMDEVEAPKPLPMGTYLATVVKFENKEAVGKNNNPACEVFFKPIQALEVSDPAALPKGWNEREIRNTFWITPEALYRWKNFVKACGINPEGMKFGETQALIRNAQVVISIVHTPNPKDPETVFANISGFAPA